MGQMDTQTDPMTAVGQMHRQTHQLPWGRWKDAWKDPPTTQEMDTCTCCTIVGQMDMQTDLPTCWGVGGRHKKMDKQHHHGADRYSAPLGDVGTMRQMDTAFL